MPFLEGKKTRTRRTWSAEYAARWKADSVHQAYDRQAQYGGIHIGAVKLTRAPFQQWLHDVTEEDLTLEGGRWATVEEFKSLWDEDLQMWVVDFEKIAGLTLEQFRGKRAAKDKEWSDRKVDKWARHGLTGCETTTVRQARL